jgi:hypothetical protein
VFFGSATLCYWNVQYIITGLTTDKTTPSS